MTLRSLTLRARTAVALIAPLVFACGGSGVEPTNPFDPGAGPWAFRASLIDPALIQKIKPLGNMSPNGHWLPTDHIYFQVADPDLGQSPVVRRTAFFAPADGIVTDVFTSPTAPDVGLRIRVTDDHRLYTRSRDSRHSACSRHQDYRRTTTRHDRVRLRH